MPRKLQVAVLAAGTAFSWFTLIADYRRFFAAGGRVFELSGCIVANPVATPCFYGALAFLAAFVASLVVLRSPRERVYAREVRLLWLLGAGTVFAWSNFAYEAIRFYAGGKGVSGFSCPPGAGGDNPFLAPCFYGALVFVAALVSGILTARGAAPSRSKT